MEYFDRMNANEQGKKRVGSVDLLGAVVAIVAIALMLILSIANTLGAGHSFNWNRLCFSLRLLVFLFLATSTGGRLA